MRKHRRIVWVLVVVFLAGAGTALWRFGPRERLLLEHSRRVADSDDFDGWISNHEIMRTILQPENPDPIAARTDLDTGKTRSAPIPDYPDTSHPSFSLSPDGNWALCWNTGGNDLPVTADSLWTNRSRHWPCEGDVYHYDLIWMPDSRSWLSMATLTDGYLNLYRLDGPGKPQRLPFPDFRTVVWNQFEALGANHLFALNREDRNTGSLFNGLDLKEFRLGAQVEHLRSFSIRLPIKGELKEYKLSPEGDRIAWVYYEERSPALSVWLHRFLRQVPVKSEPLFSLWTTDIDGRNLREIGHIPMIRPDNADEFDLTADWVPGGARLSFIYKGGLYTVPAE